VQNKVVRLHASGGVNRFRASFSQSLTDCNCQCTLRSWRFFGLIFVSVRIYGRAWEKKRKRWGREAGENRLHSTFPLAHRFLVQLRVSFRTAVSLNFTNHRRKKNAPKNKPPATQATRKGKSVYGKRQLAATDHYFPLLAVWFLLYLRQ